MKVLVRDKGRAAYENEDGVKQPAVKPSKIEMWKPDADEAIRFEPGRYSLDSGPYGDSLVELDGERDDGIVIKGEGGERPDGRPPVETRPASAEREARPDSVESVLAKRGLGPDPRAPADDGKVARGPRGTKADKAARISRKETKVAHDLTSIGTSADEGELNELKQDD